QAQEVEVEVGTRVICDTQEEVERFVALYDGDTEKTVERVNTAEREPAACSVSTMAYVRGSQLGTARSKDAAFEIAPILVLGIVTEAGVPSRRLDTSQCSNWMRFPCSGDVQPSPRCSSRRP